ncbi:hypothetical protein LZ31DRAFT_250427 [Colletotrichum somersetense]|nr:hypothetical protein LZ31DRAFT_250427 [Colletotrichum somersetense]
MLPKSPFVQPDDPPPPFLTMKTTLHVCVSCKNSHIRRVRHPLRAHSFTLGHRCQVKAHDLPLRCSPSVTSPQPAPRLAQGVSPRRRPERAEPPPHELVIPQPAPCDGAHRRHTIGRLRCAMGKQAILSRASLFKP